MQFLYSFFMYVFQGGIRLASMFVPKAQKTVEGRKNWEEHLKKEIDANKDWIWMHCSSLGEFEQGRPVFEALKKKYPNYQYALSFFSPSGYEVRENYKEADVVFYLPFDTPQNAKRLAQILKPKIWILAKYDYWYNHLKYQYANGTKIVVISAIFRTNQIYFKPSGKWFAKGLKKYIHHFFVQEEKSKELLKDIGIEQVTIAGDTRLDRVKTIAGEVPQLAWVETFKGDSKLIVIGSSWKEDEDLWVEFINKNLPMDWKVIFAPHEIDSKNIKQLCEALEKETVVYSNLIDKNTNSTQAQIMVVDTIGLLSKIYAYADIAYVGGGFNKSGVHNTLEPSVFGTAVIIGPNFQKFSEVKALRKQGVVFPISNYQELSKIVLDLIQNSSKRATIKEKTSQYFKEQLPSTHIILDALKYYL